MTREASTKDDWTYYLRVGREGTEKKKTHIRDFVLSRKEEIRFLLDVGCNTGELSAQFIEHGIEVLGVDASNRLRHPAGYRFLQQDISQSSEIMINDCTLFLSLYHHLFHSHGVESADGLFYKLLLRTRYLIFDTGTPKEQGKDREHWIRTLGKYFSSEKELLDHFHLPYQVIGAWETGGAIRTIVVFENRSFDDSVQVMDEFRRKVGTPKQAEGLFSVRKGDGAHDYFEDTRFYRLRLGDRDFFAKKHIHRDWEASELTKLIEVYRQFPKEELLTFYGRSQRFGLVYEWVDDLKYLGKLRHVWVHGVFLADADRIETGGQVKYIDFWSDPARRPGETERLLEQRISALLMHGESCYHKGDLQRGKRCFQEILAHAPEHVEAINNLGVLAFEAGDMDDALSCFSKVLSIQPGHPEAAENAAKCHESKGEYHEALKWFREVLASGNRSAETLNKAGHCLMQIEDFEGAGKMYQESLEKDGGQDTVRVILKGLKE